MTKVDKYIKRKQVDERLTNDFLKQVDELFQKILTEEGVVGQLYVVAKLEEED